MVEERMNTSDSPLAAQTRLLLQTIRQTGMFVCVDVFSSSSTGRHLSPRQRQLRELYATGEFHLMLISKLLIMCEIFC